MIDATDREILTILQQNARVSNAEIARQIHMAPSAVLERIRKLESRGVIRGYEVRIDPEALGLNLLAYIFVRTRDIGGELSTGEMLARIDEVQEVHHLAGEDCFLVKARVRDARSLGRLLRERFAASANLTSTRTTIVLETLHETTHLPLDAGPLDAGTAVGTTTDLAAAGRTAAETAAAAAALETAGDHHAAALVTLAGEVP
ncbi:MAG TPA: Lrp/AsnC family transcriptional regulator [Thermoanaerobaculia bacterium]|nr:Lrp/AsnC family transcriptional regulator [Thermoanaerobaculia bacterium]